MWHERTLQSSERPQNIGQSGVLTAADGQPGHGLLRHRAGHQNLATVELLTAPDRHLHGLGQAGKLDDHGMLKI
jgi:hypothetical protein